MDNRAIIPSGIPTPAPIATSLLDEDSLPQLSAGDAVDVDVESAGDDADVAVATDVDVAMSNRAARPKIMLPSLTSKSSPSGQTTLSPSPPTTGVPQQYVAVLLSPFQVRLMIAQPPVLWMLAIIDPTKIHISQGASFQGLYLDTHNMHPPPEIITPKRNRV